MTIALYLLLICSVCLLGICQQVSCRFSPFDDNTTMLEDGDIHTCYKLDHNVKTLLLNHSQQVDRIAIDVTTRDLDCSMQVFLRVMISMDMQGKCDNMKRYDDMLFCKFDVDEMLGGGFQRCGLTCDCSRAPKPCLRDGNWYFEVGHHTVGYVCEVCFHDVPDELDNMVE